ncbi:hypothetical protein CKF54_02025 [Psittacicella hinzii]|uniref:type I site-specific deoxyribonuclease n=1 Tax=Psittacicella hinzii TaxID=2028575 RepID=A0A3A1Y985_9GAMM|nr:DEAD/DEAH box helicase family protein [Psittacicella hinzii]RIY33886.1 hypothetical protein CKF54_02025 [Psittacicella hinzii]
MEIKTEAAFQKELISHLQNLGWEDLDPDNHHTSIEKIEKNLISIIQANNRTILERTDCGNPEFTEQEANDILKKLREKFPQPREHYPLPLPVFAHQYLKGTGGVQLDKDLLKRKVDGKEVGIPLILFTEAGYENIPENKAFLDNNYPDYKVRFQLAQEVKLKLEDAYLNLNQVRKSNRLDLVLFINGFPLFLIENKRGDKILNSEYDNNGTAIEQLEHYFNDISENKTSLLNTLQVGVALKESQARYFARPSGRKINRKFVFTWNSKKRRAGDENIPENIFLASDDYKEFVDQCLNPRDAHKLISNYILTRVTKTNDADLVLMRQYQVEAAEACIKRIKEIKFNQRNKMLRLPDQLLEVGQDNLSTVNTNVCNLLGYVWHTTGSGKTVTSFKVAEQARKIRGIDKVVFVVDRIDLEEQTYDCFTNHVRDHKTDSDISVSSVRHPADIDEKRKTQKERLLSKLKKSKKEIITTTLQTLASIDKKDLKRNFKNKEEQPNILFICDEAHRSTSGENVENIRNNFEYSAWLGFTGTPDAIQEKPTHTIFGKQLHAYTIAQAVADNNVCGFKVEYKELEFLDKGQVVSIKNFLELVNKVKYDDVLESEKYQDPNFYHDFVKELTKRKLGNSTYLEALNRKVVGNILETFNQYTRNRAFNAVLTTFSIDNAISMYKLFKEEQEKEKAKHGDEYKPLRIAILFSSASSHDDGRNVKDEFPDFNDLEADTNEVNSKSRVQDQEEIMEDFKATFSDMPVTSWVDYEDKVCTLVKERNRTEKHAIDLVIVVNKLLTGFDAPTINTLFVHKILSGANLIQAYSRTNRVAEGKEFGNIVNYFMTSLAKENFETAIKKYSAVLELEELRANKVVQKDFADLVIDLENNYVELQQVGFDEFNIEKGTPAQLLSELTNLSSDDEIIDIGPRLLKPLKKLEQTFDAIKTYAPIYDAHNNLVSGYNSETFFSDNDLTRIAKNGKDFEENYIHNTKRATLEIRETIRGKNKEERELLRDQLDKCLQEAGELKFALDKKEPITADKPYLFNVVLQIEARNKSTDKDGREKNYITTFAEDFNSFPGIRETEFYKCVDLMEEYSNYNNTTQDFSFTRPTVEAIYDFAKNNLNGIQQLTADTLTKFFDEELIKILKSKTGINDSNEDLYSILDDARHFIYSGQDPTKSENYSDFIDNQDFEIKNQFIALCYKSSAIHKIAESLIDKTTSK